MMLPALPGPSRLHTPLSLLATACRMTGDAHDEEASLAAQIRGEQAEAELHRRHPFGRAMNEPEEPYAGAGLCSACP